MSVIIRLDNLSWNSNTLDIRRYFSGLEIPDGGVHIVGGERGTAFIAFATDEDARQAMLKDSGNICNEQIKLFLSSRTEMQNLISSTRGTSVPIHEVFTNPAYGRRVSDETPTQMASRDQRSFLNYNEEIDSNRAQRLSLLHPDRQSASKRPYQEMSSGKGGLEETKYIKEQRSTELLGSQRPSLEEMRSGNDRTRDNWNSDTQRELPGGTNFRMPDFERASDWQVDDGSKREREVVVRQGSFGDRKDLYGNFGERPGVSFNRGRDEDSKLLPLKRTFQDYDDNANQDNKLLHGQHFGRDDQLPEKFACDSDRSRIGMEGIRQRGDWFVRVSNLPMDFSYRDVRRFFSKSFIPQDGLKLINDRNGRRTGECYISFANEKSFSAAIDSNNTVLSGRTIKIERTDGQRFDEALDSYLPPPEFKGRSPSPVLDTTDGKFFYYVTIKKLPIDCREDDVIKLLNIAPPKPGCGPFFAYDKIGNRVPKAFLRLDSKEEYHRVCNCHGKEVRGNKIKVFPISPNFYKERAENARKWNPPNRINMRIPGFDKDLDKKFHCIRIDGLPFAANLQMVKDFFKGLEIANNGIYIVNNRENQAMGIGFVEFVTSSDCRRALERNNQYMGKRYLVIEPITKEDLLMEFKDLQQKFGGFTHDHDDHGQQRSRSHGLDRSTADSETAVRMKNLHFKVQLEDILHFFKGYRPIMESIKLQYRGGRPTGDGLISFPSLGEAKMAINELNHRKLLGWPLTMTLDQ